MSHALSLQHSHRAIRHSAEEVQSVTECASLQNLQKFPSRRGMCREASTEEPSPLSQHTLSPKITLRTFLHPFLPSQTAGWTSTNQSRQWVGRSALLKMSGVLVVAQKREKLPGEQHLQTHRKTREILIPTWRPSWPLRSKMEEPHRLGRLQHLHPHPCPEPCHESLQALLHREQVRF